MQVKQGKLLELAETLYPPFSSLLWQMERRGVWVSLDELGRIESEAIRDSAARAKELDAFSGQTRNWNSKDEVAAFLYDQLGLPELPDEARSPKYWGKERITAYEAVEYMYRHHPERRGELDTLRAYKRAGRARNYASDLASRAVASGHKGLGTVHPVYGTYNDNASGKNRDKSGTATGRLNISNPPLQQIPRDKKKDPYRVRRAFVAPPGHRLVVVDMEQLEVRIQAHVHVALFGDTTLRDMCLGGDFHGRIAHKVFSSLWPTAFDWTSVGPEDFKEHKDPFIKWCREQVKAVFYGLAYGKGKRAFGATLWTLAGDPIGEDVAGAILDGVFAEIPAIQRFQRWVREMVTEKGGMWDLFGVWRPLTRDNRGWRQGLNQPFQGSGARIAMLWMLLLRTLCLELQVHDELVTVSPEELADNQVKQVEGAAAEVGEVLGMHCPLKGKGAHGTNWDDCK